MPRMLRVYSLAVLLLGAALLPLAFAQSSARPTPVEVVAPKPPTPVNIEGKQVLVYELHITNLGTSALRLVGLQVFAGESSDPSSAGTKLADYSDKSLTDLLHLVAEPIHEEASHPDPAFLGVGRRVIAFMYVPLPPEAAPRFLRHRLLFDVSDSSHSKGTPNDESALDGVMVPVLQDHPLTLAPPFKPGIWLAGSGPSNTSNHRRAVITLAGHPYIAQRFAIDWVMVGANGDSHHDSPDVNENYWAFGQPVLAVARGEVTEAVDSFPDNIPHKLPEATVQNILGNHVIERIAPGVYVTFCHLKRGSIRVRLHQKLKTGEQIAEIGNSGNSTGSHLHVEVTDGNSALASEGIPYIFERFRFLGYGKDFEPDHPHPDEPRTRELPADDSVIEFGGQKP